MSEPAAILATFSDLKLIRGRKVAQLVFEVPIEDAQKATNALGFPNAASEKWCAIALTNLAAGDVPKHSAEDASIVSRDTPVAKPNSTRAVMMAKDQEFWKFLRVEHKCVVESEEAADFHLKRLCRVKSKSELNGGTGEIAFHDMRLDFRAWRAAQ